MLSEAPGRSLQPCDGGGSVIAGRSADRNGTRPRSPRAWDADRSSVISAGNSVDMQVLVASGKGGVPACICLRHAGGGWTLRTAAAQWQFQGVRWLATGDTVAERKGK